MPVRTEGALLKIAGAVLLLAAIAVPSLLYATQGERESVDARIAAFKHDNGNVEFAIQVKEGNDWGERILPSKRTLGADASTGKWLVSTPVQIKLAETPVSLPAPEPVGDVHFDVAIVVRDDGQVVVEAEIDGEYHEWPTSFNLTDDDSLRSTWPSGTPTYRFAPNDVLDEETLTWKENNYWGFSVRISIERGIVVVITPNVHRTGGFYAPASLFVEGSRRMLVEQLRQDGRYDFPPFALSGLHYQRVRHTPCTAEDIYGLPRHIESGIVAYAFDAGSCYVRDGRTVRRGNNGNLYGQSGELLGCRYSVEVTPINKQFARVQCMFDQDCELRLVGGGNSEMYYLTGNYWETQRD